MFQNAKIWITYMVAAALENRDIQYYKQRRNCKSTHNLC